MAISLNTVNSTVTNHETRIKALESKGASSWTKGSNSNGYWAKETTTGLIIQWGTKSHGQDQTVTVTLPTAFASTSYQAFVTASVIYGAYTNGYSTHTYTTTTFKIAPLTTASTARWLAIGYLISNRILNYIYKAFAIIFTFIFGIRLVSKITV